MECVPTKSVKYLQQYLKERVVTFAYCKRYKQSIFVSMLQRSILRSIRMAWLKIEVLPTRLCVNWLTLVTCRCRRYVCVTIFAFCDIFNFLVRHENFSRESLREYNKLEGYTMNITNWRGTPWISQTGGVHREYHKQQGYTMSKDEHVDSRSSAIYETSG